MREREYDIVLFGATGYVGRLIARHLLQNAPGDLRIALAGRSLNRIEAVRRWLGGEATTWPALRADSEDLSSLKELAQRTQVVISTVGPYRGQGLGLVGACATAGTHYTDLTGEVLFVRDSIDCFDQAARNSGARIVHSCGADAVPSDLAVLTTALAVDQAGDGRLAQVDAYWRDLRGGASGGTLASLAEDIRVRKEDRAKARLAADPYALSPSREDEPEPRTVRSRMHVGRARSIPHWETPYLLSGFNAQIVRRSNALTDWSYGRTFRYHEALTTGRSPLGAIRAGAFAAGQAALVSGLSGGPTRALWQRVLPNPGNGPSETCLAKGRFMLEVHATTTGRASWITRFGARKDPGYTGTAVMIGEAALALALGDQLPDRAGVLTPATGIGSILTDRLRAQGFLIDTRREDGTPGAAPTP
ncbi:saccharopine dehydrogenase family protein [Austwickia chelonae]|uniref:saccharopine dehydrogenase family protein n=1 Tax=Austwickia chelonae TaxID=100225 RepID=UPI000E26391A|nr:saccharopine dehydrogenase NADP-binding domain-containing protein [Austwickia chelonae]